LTHTLHPHEEHVGFNFLGFSVRQYPVGKTHSGKRNNGQLLGFKTIIKPSPEAQQRHLKDLADVIRRHRQSPQQVLIDHLNRKIGGWANYYASVVSKAVFNRADHLLYLKLKRWAERRHPTKSRGWVARHYWRPQGTRTRVFKPKGGTCLAHHADTPIVRHVKVEGTRSVFDGDWSYWARRLGRHPELSKSKAELLKRQKGRCAHCGLFFVRMDELLEIDHTKPLSQGGRNWKANRQLLHRHCHDAKTATDGSNRLRSSEVPVSRAKITGCSGTKVNSQATSQYCRGAG
ncbi:MAG TPA: group II intron maturase-specific domain-containing protein, partial [Nitrolancea sp.]|nr:group II intron maturase-specific domain-containing protein [Nitrolancea sp.]